MNIPRETLLSLYRDMLRRRCVEETIESLYHEEVETPAELARMVAQIETEIENAFAFATASLLPKGEDLLLHVYGE